MSALEGTRVIDLSTGIAGGFCTKLLGDFGADVIKVEPPGGGGLRDFGPFADAVSAAETGALHLYLDTSKRSITLDLGTPTGQELLARLLATADAVVDDRPLGNLESEGFSASRLSADFPQLVVSYLSTYGQSGPWAQLPSTNLTAFAVGGQMATTGDPDREPLKNGGSQADYQLGLNGFTATLAGLWAASDSGTGDAIDVAGMECMASTLELMLNTYAYAHIDYWNGRKGNVLSGVLGLYPCENGYLGVHAMPRNFPALARLMDADWMLEDERFRDAAGRLAHDDELRAMVYAWASGQEKHAAYERAGQAHAPVAYVHEMSDLFQSPQLTARDYLQELNHPVAGELTYPGPLFRMADTPSSLRRAPLLGGHTGEVLAELGLQPHDIEVLRGTGVV
ncbi:MAG TPA: CoA transferase [Tepidiformaceae bacterium]|nr:CoA transferase [Tepidiformaceae bacterium]